MHSRLYLVCSGSVVEDIDMTEDIASVASDGRKVAALPALPWVPPVSLCSALLLAANAACRPTSSHCSLHSYDTNENGTVPSSDGVSDVVAHLDTVCA